MKESLSIEKCIHFVECQIRELNEYNPRKAAPFITLSRQAGAGGHKIGNELCKRLSNPQSKLKGPWTLFDSDLVKKVLDDHNLPHQIANYMPEKKISEINSTIEEILGLHPSHWKLLGDTAETIYNLARLGKVILIGRASHIITQKLPYGIHIRLISSEKTRIQYLMEIYKFNHKEAENYMHLKDQSRYDYLKNYYNNDINDPSSYDLVINTDNMATNTVIQIIETMLHERLA